MFFLRKNFEQITEDHFKKVFLKYYQEAPFKQNCQH